MYLGLTVAIVLVGTVTGLEVGLGAVDDWTWAGWSVMVFGGTFMGREAAEAEGARTI